MNRGTDTDQQGADSVAHITYYDRAHDLSFVWDGTVGARVSVCSGGYAEPESDHFNLVDYMDIDETFTPVNTLAFFGRACSEYLSARYGESAIVAAFRMGVTGIELNDANTRGRNPSEPWSLAYLAGKEIAAKIEHTS